MLESLERLLEEALGCAVSKAGTVIGSFGGALEEVLGCTGSEAGTALGPLGGVLGEVLGCAGSETDTVIGAPNRSDAGGPTVNHDGVLSGCGAEVTVSTVAASSNFSSGCVTTVSVFVGVEITVTFCDEKILTGSIGVVKFASTKPGDASDGMTCEVLVEEADVFPFSKPHPSEGATGPELD